MTKKYKLKQWYPSLPNWVEEGDIAKEVDKTNTKHNYVIKKRRCSDSKFVKVYKMKKQEVENQSEFWEEVEDRDYRILSFYYTNTLGEKDYENLAKIQKNGSYQKFPIYSRSTLGSSLESMLNAERWNIYSVERLSDEEVFTIGDKIKGMKRGGEITDISIRRLNKVILHIKGDFGIHLSKASKSKFLFTTEDGVDIYEGDSYYVPQVRGISNNDYYDNIIEFTATSSKNYESDDSKRFFTMGAARSFVDKNRCLFTTEDGVDIYRGDKYYMVSKNTDYRINNIIAHDRSGKEPSRYAYFSTQEKAEEYVEEHKPRFSKAELRRAVEDISKKIYGTTSVVDKRTGVNLPEDLVNNLIKKMESYDLT